MYTSIDLATAGQNIATYYGTVQRSTSSPRISWYEKDTQTFIDPYEPLTLEQFVEKSYYLYAEVDNDVASATAHVLIHNYMENDHGYDEYSDISTHLPIINNRKICTFKRENDGAPLLCEVKFLASESSPVESSCATVTKNKRGVIALNHENKDVDLGFLNKELCIKPLSSVGNISITDPNDNAKSLTAIAVSDNPQDDDVPLKVQIASANPDVKSLKFEFKFADPNIANSDGKSIGTCEIKNITDGRGSCTINITPNTVGKTIVSLESSSTWISTDEKAHPLNTSQSMQINVGTLFAGYNGSSITRRLYRKNSELTSIPDEAQGSVIRGLALDEPQHKLYVMNQKTLYEQESVTENALNLVKVADVSGRDNPNAQTLSLPDIKNTVIIGTGYGEFFMYQRDDSGKLNRLPISSPNASLLHTAIDPTNNVLYFSEEKTGLVTYYTKYIGTNKPKYVHNELTLVEHKLNSMQVAAYGSKLYTSGNNLFPNGGSVLNLWDAKIESMVSINLNKNIKDPFEKTPNVLISANRITSLFFSRQGRLYATSSDGNLYYLNNRESKNPNWELVATVTKEVTANITDNAIDTNGTIYLSSKIGVWKVPFNNPKNAYKLDNYGKDVSAIVVDNNR